MNKNYWQQKNKFNCGLKLKLEIMKMKLTKVLIDSKMQVKPQQNLFPSLCGIN